MSRMRAWLFMLHGFPSTSERPNETSTKEAKSHDSCILRGSDADGSYAGIRTIEYRYNPQDGSQSTRKPKAIEHRIAIAGDAGAISTTAAGDRSAETAVAKPRPATAAGTGHSPAGTTGCRTGTDTGTGRAAEFQPE